MANGAATYRVTNAIARRLAIQPDIARIAGQVADAARAGSPKGPTGRLAAGWRTVPGRDPGTTLIQTDVPYARYVEYGTRNRPASAMLGRALAAARGAYR
jgi:hypothetical protein